VNYYGTAGSGEQNDEYHRPFPEPQPEARARQGHEGAVPPPPNPGGGQWPPAHPVEDATQMFPPYPAYEPPGGFGPPEAPAADATQLLPPQAPAPVRGAGDATQLLPPQPPAPAGDASTTRLRQVPAAAGGVDATQVLPPCSDQRQYAPPRQPEPQSGFAHLYRQDGPPPMAQAPTRPGYPQQGYAPQGYQQQAHGYEPEPSPRKRLSPAVLIGLIVVGCAGVGLAAGAILSGGDGDPATAAGGKSAAAASGSPSAAPSATAADPAEQQAKQLDALLRVSGDSRSFVIQAVADIKGCQNLDGAAADLRSVANQREVLVARLGQLSIDKLPNNDALRAALTRAWKASAAADDHYAGWADQVAGKKGCKGGHARVTGQTAQGNTQSGTATQAKKIAVRLWNSIATQYGLTQRTYVQL
jgi:hypothetical protein